MANNININTSEVDAIIGSALNEITNVQSDINTVYENLISGFSESAGDEADALRDQLAAENKLVGALSDMLSQFSQSIQFAAGEFENLDQTGASKMAGKEKGRENI